MCNGFSTRTSLGGAVAYIVPTSSSRFSSCLLQFHNPPDSSSLPTNMSCTPENKLADCEVRIHTLGDLTAGVESAGNVLHSLLPLELAEKGQLVLDRRLDLGVGGDGIIGRTVSVVKGGIVLGEGIIGWN
ncbi:hypothetical protein FN846DRAFT_296942 [Sphaerosporella brunnea]|uniref:Uncharacterized protein n=1 Tax=Sphaerosporella brunnea TaxID=1250544 RepID=A0A5J5ELF7_9PEZI|nr:hypothetical protein FN846DRAFT_296942 [Sphaerosporella brunnea]